MYKHETTSRHESTVFEGVTFYLNKMTEGRRIELRAKIAEPNRRVRDILREQAEIEGMPEDTRDHARWLSLSDEYDELLLEKINPDWIVWGCKKVEGLEADGKPLDVADWKEWPSALFDEVLTAIRSEAELKGEERKNFELRSTSIKPGGLTPNPSTADSAGGEGSGEIAIAGSTSQVQ